MMSRMNIEQIEQKCSETLYEYAQTMANAYVDHPEDYKAAVTGLLVRTIELHLDKPIDINRLFTK